jgi:hypothetical protein
VGDGAAHDAGADDDDLGRLLHPRRSLNGDCDAPAQLRLSWSRVSPTALRRVLTPLLQTALTPLPATRFAGTRPTAVERGGIEPHR